MLHQLSPVVGRVDVDFDHAGVGRDLQQLQARVARRRVAFQHDLHAQFPGGGLDGGEQVEVVLQEGQRRHEDVEDAGGAALLLRRGAVGAARVARLHAQGGAGDPVRRLEAAGRSRVVAGRRQRGGARVLHAQRGARLRRRAEGVGHVAQVGGRHALAGVAPAQVVCRGQCRRRRIRIALNQVGEFALAHPRLRIERQPVAHGRVAGHEVEPVVAQEPGAGLPARAGELRAAARVGGWLQRQHVADHRIELLREHAAQAGALQFVVQLRIEGVDVHRQAAFAPEVVVDVLVGGLDEGGREAQLLRQPVREALGVGAGVVRRLALVGEQGRIVPGRLAVGAPEDRQRPARQLLARVPLALAEVQEAALAVFLAQPVHQLGGVAALGGAEGVGVPLRRIAVAAGDEGGLAAHGQAHVAGRQARVDRVAQRQHGGPLVVGVGPRHPRRLVHARDLHLVAEVDLGLVHQALDGRGAGGCGCAGQRDVALAGQQARGGIQADPAGAGQVDLAPGVQVGEVVVGAARAVERLDVGRELDQVA